jgi:hypothetical protein
LPPDINLKDRADTNWSSPTDETKSLCGFKKGILASMILLPLVPFFMETAYTMITQNKRRLTIIDSGEVIGIIREQDLFFEIERILREV